MDLLDLRKPFNAGAQALGTERRALLPQRAFISEGVCEPTEARIDCLAPTSQLPPGMPETLPGHPRDTSLPVDSIDLLAPQWRLVPCGVGLRSWNHEAMQVAGIRVLSDGEGA